MSSIEEKTIGDTDNSDKEPSADFLDSAQASDVALEQLKTTHVKEVNDLKVTSFRHGNGFFNF